MWNFPRGKLRSLLMVNADKWGAKIKKRENANLLLCNLFVLPALSSQLSVFSKLFIMNTLLHFLLLLCQSCRSFRNVSLGGRILGLIKSAHHSWLNMLTSLEGTLFSLASGPPTLKPPLVDPLLFTWLRSGPHFLNSRIVTASCYRYRWAVNYVACFIFAFLLLNQFF